MNCFFLLCMSNYMCWYIFHAIKFCSQEIHYFILLNIAEYCQDVVTSCVRLGVDEMTWFDARKNCSNEGGDLFYLKIGETFDHSMPLFSSLYWEIREITQTGHLHIGIRHRIWEWNGRYLFYSIASWFCST